MKKYLSALIVVVFIIGIGSVATAAAEDYKFGYVDFNRALNEVDEGKRTKSSLKAEFEKKQKKPLDTRFIKRPSF